MEKTELKKFYNHGFGWICKHCERELKAKLETEPARSRLLQEGEAETKQPKFSTSAMAKWGDAEQKILTCPRCGATERVDNG